TARAELDSIFAALDSALSLIAATPMAADPDPEPLRAALARASRFGIPGAFPPSRHDASPAALEALLALAGPTRSALADRARADHGAATPVQRLQALFGPSFRTIPRFRPAAPAILAPALGAEPDFGGRSDAEIEGWLAGVARVREPVAAWRHLS